MTVRLVKFSTVVGTILTTLIAARPVLSQQATVPVPLTFEAALDIASGRNLFIEAARRRRAIREAAIRTASLRPNPDLSGEITRDTPHQALSLDIPIETGQRSRRINLAREELSLADVDVQLRQRTVRRQVRETFYSLIAADLRAQLADSVLDISRRIRDAAQARFETGATPQLEVFQADLAVTRAETDVDIARSERASAQARLNGLLNLPPQQPLVVNGLLSDHSTTPPFEVALSQATAANPDLVNLDRQIAVEQRRIELLRIERRPTPIFSIGGVFNAPGEFDAGLRVGASVGLPLFSRNQGEIAASIATTAQLRGERDATRRDIENALFAASARVEAGRRQIDAFSQRLVPTAENLETLSEESYRAGRTSVLGVLDAQRSLRDLSREALQAALDLQLSLAELEDLLGAPLP